MDLLETSQFYDRCQALGVIPQADGEQVLDYVGVWQSTLADVPLDFAIRQAERHPGPYMLRPSFVRGAWDQQQERLKALDAQETAKNPRACPWARVCRCSHAEGVCLRGWVDEVQTDQRGYAVAEWCDLCWDAKNLIREEHGKTPRPLGIVGRG